MGTSNFGGGVNNANLSFGRSPINQLLVVQTRIAHERRSELLAVALLLPLRLEVSRTSLLITRSAKVAFRVVETERRPANMPDVVVNVAVLLPLLPLVWLPVCLEVGFAGAAIADASSLRGSVAEVVAIANVCKELGGHEADDVSGNVAIAM